MSVKCRQCGFENAEGAVFCAGCQATVVEDLSMLEDLEPLPEDFEDQVRAALSDKVQILREVGRGGMAVVYEGLDLELNRKVALKCLPLESSQDKGLVQRFHMEAKLAAGLTHPHIVPIYAVGTRDRIHYFTMAFLQGGSLEDRIASGLSLEESVEIVCQIASALDYAHGKKLVHRDIKPSNVMFDENGTVRVLDFGVARLLHEARLTITRAILGTPEYMSPEQALSRPLDGRADLYALGVMFYQMVTGTLPFTADEPLSLIYKHVNEKPTPPHRVVEQVPPALSRIILKLMSKAPEKRYASGAELIAELRGPSLTGAVQPRAARRGAAVTETIVMAVRDRWDRTRRGSRLMLAVLPVIFAAFFLLRPAGGAQDAFPVELPLETASVEASTPPDEVPSNATDPTEPAETTDPERTTETPTEEGGDPLPAEVPERQPTARDKTPDKPAPVVRQPPRDQTKTPVVDPKLPAPDPVATLMATFDFAEIHGASFRMGGLFNGKDAYPGHDVSLSAYALSRTEVTQELWEAVMGTNPSCNKGKSLPVEHVSWNDAMAFIAKLNTRVKAAYRLPTEAEWEYAAKTGKRGPYGPLNLDSQGWYERNATMTQPVRGKDPNGVGLFDIHGNVWEWCADFYAADYYEHSPERDPKGPESGSERVLRGGAFNVKDKDTKPQRRHFLPADTKDCAVGFRLAMSL